jgi:uncharacterized spore protein YtfJ
MGSGGAAGATRKVLTVRRVFGEPIERDGTTVIPAARLRGRAGGRRARKRNGMDATQSGLKLAARPAGALVIRDGTVSWQPAIDLNRIVAGGQLVVVTIAGLAYFMLRQRRADHR